MWRDKGSVEKAGRLSPCPSSDFTADRNSSPRWTHDSSKTATTEAHSQSMPTPAPLNPSSYPNPSPTPPVSPPTVRQPSNRRKTDAQRQRDKHKRKIKRPLPLPELESEEPEVKRRLAEVTS